MRILWVFCLLACINSADAALRFDGEAIALPASEWLLLSGGGEPAWQEQQHVVLDDYAWKPLEGGDNTRVGLGVKLLRTDIEVTYAGSQSVLLVIPYAFIPEIQVGMVSDTRMLMWKDLDSEQRSKELGQHRAIGAVILPITQPGKYQLLIRGSNVANSIIINDARLMLNDDFVLHDYPLSISIASSFIGAAFICLWMCIALLLYRFMLPFLYALIYIAGAIGTLLLREGIIFISLPLDVAWWAKHILPFCMGLMYSGLLCYVGADLQRSGWRRGYKLVTVCGLVAFGVGVLNIFFPIREHLALGLTGFAFAFIGFVSSLFLLTWRAISFRRIREALFAIVFGSFFVAMLVRTGAALLEFKTTISVIPWYLTILMVAAYIFVEYILMLTKEHVDTANQRTADSTRFDLVSRFSHELRTPLNAVIGLADLLKDANEVDKVRRLADMIQKAGNTLLQLVNDILDFSKLGSKQMLLANNKLRLDCVVSEVVSGFLPRLLSERISIQFNAQPSMPFFLLGDELRLKQILGNLLSNAIKFSPADTAVAISFEQRGIEEDSVELFCSIRDQGRGIPAHQIDSVFEPFSQVYANDDSIKGGTGLGLAICKLLVEQMGGNLQVQSKEGEGSTFSFNVWVKSDPDAPDMSRIFSVWQGKRVLLRTVWLYEDSPVKQHLAYWGAEVTATDSFSNVKGTDFDMVITDTGIDCTADDQGWLAALPSSIPVHVIEVRPAEWVQTLSDRDNFRLQRVPCQLLTLLIRLTEHLCGDSMNLEPEEIAHFDNRLHNNNHKVLLVDDNTVNLVVAGKMLAALDIQSDMVQGGEEALDKLKASSHYTMVLLDCEMPDVDGFEVARRWREHEREQQLTPVPIVALTAHALDEVQEDCLAAGMDEVLFKPINRTVLVGLFNRHVAPISG